MQCKPVEEQSPIWTRIQMPWIQNKIRGLSKKKLVESKTRTYYGQVGSGRTAGQRGETGKTRRRQNSSPKRQAPLVPPKATHLLNVSRSTN